MFTRDELIKKIAKFDKSALKKFKRLAIPFGINQIDQILPSKGLETGTVNQIIGDKVDNAAIGFGAALLSLFLNNNNLNGSVVLWCRKSKGLYAPGMRVFNLKESQLLLTYSDKDKDILWAMEEGLRSGVLVGVLGEFQNLTTIIIRRLQLASELANLPTLILSKEKSDSLQGLIATRWKVSSLPSLNKSDFLFSQVLTEILWQLELVYCQNGATGNWDIKWQYNENEIKSNKKTCGFALAS